MLVIGGSVTGGGGVWANLSLAWPAILASRLRGGRGAVRSTFKNAVDPSFFLHCPDRFFDGVNADAVLLDFGPNLFSPESSKSLARLACEARRRTGAVFVGMTAWPRRNYVKQDLASVESAAEESGSVPIRIDATRSLARLGGLYADAVHPNAAGHKLLADACFAALEALEARSVPWGDSNATADSKCSSLGNRPVKEEVCFSNATKLPVISSKGFRLLDQGKNNVRKFGWVSSAKPSSHEDRFLTIKADNPYRVRGYVAHLGFLATPHSGSFRVLCATGCTCSPIRNYHQGSIYPFPEIKTSDFSRGQHIAVTETTSFTILSSGDRRGCNVTVHPTEPREVRVDAFYLRPASPSDTENAGRSRRPQHREFAEHALDDMGVVKYSTVKSSSEP